jgi:predicted phosphodiesterase
MSNSNSNLWSKLTTSLINTISKQKKQIKSLNDQNVEKLDSFFNVALTKEFIKEASRRKKERFISLLNILGIEIKDGKIKINLSVSEIVDIISQFAPIAKYVSVDMLDRIIPQLNSSEYENITKAINALAKAKKLVDFMMKFINDKQFDTVTLKQTTTDKVKETLMAKTNKNLIDKTETLLSNADEDIISALKVENKRLSKQIEHGKASRGSDKILMEHIEESINKILPEIKFIREKWDGGKQFSKSGVKASAVLHVSDWHIGCNENINGFNSFNYEIAQKRVKELTNKTIDWTKMHRHMYNVDELVIVATGDFISGDIHDELIRTNEFSVPEQCVKAATLFSKMTNEFSAHFKKVRVEYIVADNHSRTTQKIQFGDGTNSYNYIVGYMSKIMLSGNNVIEFNLYPEIQKVIQVQNRRYLITHGNCVRGGFAGIPFYSLNRKIGAEATIRMNMPESMHFDMILMGHYHTPMLTKDCEMTGCLSSTTAFDHAAGRHCPACQNVWLVSDNHEMDFCEMWLK